MRDDRTVFRIMDSFRKLNFSSILPNISHADFMILKVIKSGSDEAKHPVKVSYIIKKLHMMPSAVSRNLKNIEKEGYIKRKVDKEDRRNTYVELTDEGYKRLEETEKIMHDLTDSIFAQVGEERMNRFTEDLSFIYQIASQEINNRRYHGRKDKKDE